MLQAPINQAFERDCIIQDENNRPLDAENNIARVGLVFDAVGRISKFRHWIGTVHPFGPSFHRTRSRSPRQMCLKPFFSMIDLST
jgi:hypothetical protein